MRKGDEGSDYLYNQCYDVDQVIVDAERCLECQHTQTSASSVEPLCIGHCALGLNIPKAMAAIADRAFVVREGVREEMQEAAAAAYARKALNDSFSCG
jgi:hypothetical protein